MDLQNAFERSRRSWHVSIRDGNVGGVSVHFVLAECEDPQQS